MKKYLVLYLTTAVVLVSLDAVWLGVIAKDFLSARLGHLLAPEVKLWAAVVFYLIYPIGVVIFASAPALAGGSWATALKYGALFGFFAYATYDLTNLATLRDWPLAVAGLDVAWGTLVTGISATAGVVVERLMRRSR